MDKKDCNPCLLCKNYFCDYDRQTGYYDEGCLVTDELTFFEDDVKPCPAFKPGLASDGLYEQLYYEEEAAQIKAENE